MRSSPPRGTIPKASTLLKKRVGRRSYAPAGVFQGSRAVSAKEEGGSVHRTPWAFRGPTDELFRRSYGGSVRPDASTETFVPPGRLSRCRAGASMKKAAEETDRSLLERVRRGDTDGAGALFERYAPALVKFADRMLSDRPAAEEVTQEVFLKVISRAHQYDGRAEVSSWLFAIAANACRDRRRRTRRAPVVPLEAIPELP